MPDPSPVSRPAGAAASVVLLRIDGPIHDLGDGIRVRRVLPSPQRIAVGPFVLLDHLGPLTLQPGLHFDVRPHPHIGLSTLTYLWEGRVAHRDGSGVDQVIEPGAVNLMRTGRGIVHSERQVDADRGGPLLMHGLQIWLVPPARLEDRAPGFTHTPVDALPLHRPQQGVTARVVAGTAWGLQSPVPIDGPTLYVDARLSGGSTLAVPDEHPQRALYLVSGALRLNEAESVQAGELVLLEPGMPVMLAAQGDCHVVMLGGAPIDKDWHIWWNFAATEVAAIEAAKAGWLAQRWPMVAGDPEFIPLPAPDERTLISISGQWPSRRDR